MPYIFDWFPWVSWLAGLLVLAVLIRTSRIVVLVSNDSIGVIEKLWSLKGSLKEGFIALDGSAGFQPEILRGGVHFFFPYQYRIHIRPLPTVPQGTIGYVFARSGADLAPGQVLGSLAEDVPFEDVRAFLSKGGQRGPQRRVLREGVYAINPAQFVILTSEGNHVISLSSDRAAIDAMRETIEARDGFKPIVLRDTEDSIGVVTVHDGPPLDHGQLIAERVGTDPTEPSTYHNSFQDPERFLAAGGRRGRQEQVLVEGTYYLNCLFATVQQVSKTVIDIGKVGVVISYTGREGSDTSGQEFKHGELVENGTRGVWKKALQAGKYALNTHGLHVIPVPTTNFVLRWIAGTSEQHGYDSNLSEIQLITKDAFEPILPLSIVVHIAYEDAPLVVQQFADLKLLVEQTLDPMVSAYFKDAAQSFTLLELVNQRAEIQRKATEEMKVRFMKYRLNLMEVMIGTPRPKDGDKHMAMILDQLRQRQVADEQAVTFENRRKASEKEREANEAAAAAAAQAALTESKIQVEVSENKGSATLRLRTYDADAIKVTAQANGEATKIAANAKAEQIKVEGEAEASKVRAVGLASAESVKAQVDAFGGPEYQLRKEIAMLLEAAITGAKVPLVPHVMLSGQEGGKGTTAVDALLGMVLDGKLPPAKKASDATAGSS